MSGFWAKIRSSVVERWRPVECNEEGNLRVIPDIEQVNGALKVAPINQHSDGTVGNVGIQSIVSVPGVEADVDAPAINTAAVVTYAAIENLRHVVTGIVWAYIGGAPTGGRLTITNGAAIIFDIDIFAQGVDSIVFPRPKSGSINGDLVITLAAGGKKVLGKLSILNHYTEE